MIRYVCKYTPLEIFAGFHAECKEIDSLAEDFEVAGIMAHDNLCGFGKSLLQEVLASHVKELVLVNCCDTMRRIYDVINDAGVCDFIYMIDLPHRCNCCSIQSLAKQFKKLSDAYAAYSGIKFDKEAFIDAICSGKDESQNGDYIGILGVRCGNELEKEIASKFSVPVKNLTCNRNRNVILPQESLKELDDEALMERYAEAVLAQFPCGRMGMQEQRREIFLDPCLKGVIYHTIKFCDYYEMEYNYVKEHLDIPVLKLETDYTRQNEGQLRTRIEAFAETLQGLGVSQMADTSGEKQGKTSKNHFMRRTLKPKELFVAGIDSGSTSTDVVIMNADKEIVSSVIIPTGAGASISAEEALHKALDKAGLSPESIRNIIKTGYGRDYIEEGSESVTEITCHAKGAHFLCPEARTVIDIGGQDSKVIRIDENGAVINFVMNDKCAAGTGRFLEMMARTLGLDMETFSRTGLDWKEDIPISSMCTVFAESEVVSLVAQNKAVADIVHGLNNSVAFKVSSLARRVNGCEVYTMTGGVANNAGVVKALEEKLQAELKISEHAQLCGAIGAALIALEHETDSAVRAVS